METNSVLLVVALALLVILGLLVWLRWMFRIILVGAIIGTCLIAAVMLYAALMHNPQGEFCRYVAGDEQGSAIASFLGQEPCLVDWAHWLSLGLFPVIILFIPAVFVIFAFDMANRNT